jgi:hypothetical protein
MRLCGKRPKAIAFSIVTLVSFYFMLVNFFDDSSSGAGLAHDRNIHLFHLAEEQHDPNHQHHPVDGVVEAHRHERPRHRLDDELRRRVEKLKKDDEAKQPPSAIIIPVANETIQNINNETHDKKELQPVKIRRFLAYDGGGFGAVNAHISKCANNIEIEITGNSDRFKDTDFSYFHMNAPSDRLGKANAIMNNKTRKHYVMVYTMESEVHSFGGDTWSRADFKMWYHLDLSWPEPATYFDTRMHLSDLLAPPRVPFEQKENSSPIVWVVSNCNAYNGRERFMRKLMSYVGVDSYGGCMKNKFSHPSRHMRGNVQLYAKYKFVISIENSNCEDYVTEKLVHAVASGSIPIVAGKDNRPNYLKFMPKNSYINIYDYKTVEELAKRIKEIAASKQEYEKFIHFKNNAQNYTRTYLKELSIGELIDEAKTVMKYESEREFFDGIVTKEKSEDKLCKIGRYLSQNSPEQIQKDVETRRANRPDASLACLKRSNLANDFKLDE